MVGREGRQSSCLPSGKQASNNARCGVPVQEEARIDNYLHVSSKQKLLKVVEDELLANNETILLEKENSGCAALLRDDKVRTHICHSPHSCYLSSARVPGTGLCQQHIVV
jgi:hypothetical protein